MKTNRSKRNLLVLAIVLALTVAIPSFGQEANSSQQVRPSETQPAAANQDPLDGLQLSGEQRASIRAIRLANRDEQMAVNQRLRRAQMALEDALDADYPNESLVEQRAKEVGDAQVAAIRMRSLREVRIRRVLTPEQQTKLREIRNLHREDEAGRQPLRKNQIKENRRNLPNRGNGVAPRQRLRLRDLPPSPR